MHVYFSFVDVTRVYDQVTTRCHYLKGATTLRKGKQLASLRCHISHPMLNSQDKVLYIIVSTLNLLKGKKDHFKDRVKHKSTACIIYITVRIARNAIELLIHRPIIVKAYSSVSAACSSFCTALSRKAS